MNERLGDHPSPASSQNSPLTKGGHRGVDSPTTETQSPSDSNPAPKAPAARKQSGQIIERGKNNYLLRIFLGRDGATGRRRYLNEKFHGNKKAAQTRLTKLLGDRDIGTLVEPTKSTLGEYLDHWLKVAVKPKVRDRTLRGYTEVIDRYIRPSMGVRRLSKIGPLEIQHLYSAMIDRGLSAKTVRLTHGVLRSALNQAVKWRKLGVNPALAVELPKAERKEMSALSPEQAGKFLKEARTDRYGALFSVALTTGMRPGEYLALQWKDIDLEKGTLIVRRTLVPKKGKDWEFSEPKTAKSRRLIPIPPSVTKELKAHRRNQAVERLEAGEKYTNRDLVFATLMGDPVHERNLVNRHFKKILERAELPSSLRLYDLRHSCATLLLAQGEHPKVVSERLGHASVTLTLDTYSHVLPTMQEKATEKLEETLFGKRKKSSKRSA